MNLGYDLVVLCNMDFIFGFKLFYGEFLMRFSREKKGKKIFVWMKVDGWVMLINDFLFIYLFLLLFNICVIYYCVIRGFCFVKLCMYLK